MQLFFSSIDAAPQCRGAAARRGRAGARRALGRPSGARGAGARPVRQAAVIAVRVSATAPRRRDVGPCRARRQKAVKDAGTPSRAPMPAISARQAQRLRGEVGRTPDWYARQHGAAGHFLELAGLQPPQGFPGESELPPSFMFGHVSVLTESFPIGKHESLSLCHIEMRDPRMDPIASM